MSSANQSNVTLPSETAVQVVREFNAPPARVYQAHHDPDLLPRWLSNPGWDMEIERHEFAVGGGYKFTWKAANGEGSFSFEGEFREIVPNVRIVQVERFVGAPGHCLVTTTFEDLGGRTRLTTHMDYDSKESRDMAVGTGMTDGMEVCYSSLEQILSA